MTGNLITTPFTETSAAYSKAVSWIGSFGVNVEKGKILECKNNLRALTLVKTSSDARKTIREKGYGDLVDSLFEARELILIQKGLSMSRVVGLTPKLREYVKGTLAGRKETHSSRKPADTAFELRIGALFSAAGYDVAFTRNADLEIDDSGRKIFVECKRPSSQMTIERGIKEAFDQVSRRCNESDFDGPQYGIVAISMTKIRNPDQKLLLVKDKERLGKELSSILTHFAKTYQPFWERELDIRCVGVIIHFQTISIVQELNLITPAEHFGWWFRGVKGRSEYFYFDEVTRRLSANFQQVST